MKWLKKKEILKCIVSFINVCWYILTMVVNSEYDICHTFFKKIMLIELNIKNLSTICKTSGFIN